MTSAMTEERRGLPTTPKFSRSTPTPRLTLQIEREGSEVVSRTVTASGEALRIGSNDANDVVLRDPMVSRFHCRIERGPRGWRLVDQDSLNGTRIAGVRMRECDLPLADCRIELGDSVIVVSESPSSASVEVLD